MIYKGDAPIDVKTHIKPLRNQQIVIDSFCILIKYIYIFYDQYLFIFGI